MTREECKERLNRPTPLFEITIEGRSLILKPRFPILGVPGKLDGTLNALLQTELERVAFRTMITQDSLSWLCDKLSAYTVRLWEEGKVVILGPKWTTDHAKAEMIHVWRGR